MASSETGIFEVMEVDDDDDNDLLLFAEDQDSNDISLHIDFTPLPNNNNNQQSSNEYEHKSNSHSKYKQEQIRHQAQREKEKEKDDQMPPPSIPLPLPPKTNNKSKRYQSRIEVVVRKRPLNSKEINNGETDIGKVHENEKQMTVCEPRLKVDLTKFTQLHEFNFDHCFDDHVTNEQIYIRCVKPLFDTILKPSKNHKFAGKATCFGYGQTGSGKTYTLLGSEDAKTGKYNEGLYAMAVRDLFKYLPSGNEIEVSFYEIYGGKLYDLLSERKQILCREDGKQKVNIIGLTRIKCESAESLMNVISAGNGIRQTGSTGANNSSSRSHAILSMDILPIRGRLSFIDLAGSERGADTQNNNKQTRMEGAEINKSLLALKECIRALDMNSLHKPFRGSKLTQVLKESFMGNSRTLMIANISPNSGSCENTLNTLRYAYRVKELKGENERNVLGKALSRNASEPNLNSYRGISRPNTAKRKRKQEIKKNNSNKKSNNRLRSKPNYQNKRRKENDNKKFKMPSPKTKKKNNESISEQFVRKKNRISPPNSFLMSNNKKKNEMDVDEKLAVPVVKRNEDNKFSKKQLIKAHRKHIDEFMILIKEDMQLLKGFDKDEFDTNAYQQKLENVLDRQTKAVQRYKAKVFNYQ